MKLPKFEKHSKKKGPATALRFPAVAPSPKQATAWGSVAQRGIARVAALQVRVIETGALY